MIEAPRTSDPDRWGDLSLRLMSGGGIAIVGLAATSAGGVWLSMVAIFVSAVMIWELWSMIDPDRPVVAMLLTALTAALTSGQIMLAAPPGALLFCVVPTLGWALLPRYGGLFAVYALAIQLAVVGLVSMRAEMGLSWLLWIVGVVIASDIFGYFAGRLLGGPKVWPKISPKKTWSGTVAGWVGAVGMGGLFMLSTGIGALILPLSVLACIAGQLGDIAESAVKRRFGVKDSSGLIPGHGGVLDRFDALTGALLFVLAVYLLSRITGMSI